jgi:hypothetical protein
LPITRPSAQRRLRAPHERARRTRRVGAFVVPALLLVVAVVGLLVAFTAEGAGSLVVLGLSVAVLIATVIGWT